MIFQKIWLKISTIEKQGQLFMKRPSYHHMTNRHLYARPPSFTNAEHVMNCINTNNISVVRVRGSRRLPLSPALPNAQTSTPAEWKMRRGVRGSECARCAPKISKSYMRPLPLLPNLLVLHHPCFAHTNSRYVGDEPREQHREQMKMRPLPYPNLPVSVGLEQRDGPSG